MRTNVSKIDFREPPNYLGKFHRRYSERFKTKTRDGSNEAMNYMLGGLHLEKKLTLTNIPEVVPDTKREILFSEESSLSVKARFSAKS